MRATRPTLLAAENTARLRSLVATGAAGTAVLDIEHSLRWHDPGRFNGYVLSQHFAGTPVDPVNLRDALRAVKDRAAGPALGALRVLCSGTSETLGSLPVAEEKQTKIAHD